MSLTTKRLQHLVSLAKHEHFGRAAESLNISQPALSKSIQGLEASLGVNLLDRTRKGVVLTAAGELVLKRGSELLHHQNELLRDLKLLADLELGYTNVALGPYPSIISGYPAAARMHSRHPKIRVSLHTNDWRNVIARVISQQADFGVAEVSEYENDSRLEIEILGEHQSGFFCRPDHPALSQRLRSLADLAIYPWAATRIPKRLTSKLPLQPCPAGHFDQLTGDFIPAIDFSVPIHLGSFIVDTDVLVVGSLGLFEAELEAGRATFLPGVTFISRYGFIRLKARTLSPASIAFMSEIRAVEAEFVQKSNILRKRYQ